MTRFKLIPVLGILSASLLASCEQADTQSGEGGDAPPPPESKSQSPSAPPAPSPEILAALQAQEFGRKLIGKTVLLADGQFVPSDLRRAPEYYLIHYSASW